MDWVTFNMGFENSLSERVCLNLAYPSLMAASMQSPTVNVFLWGRNIGINLRSGVCIFTLLFYSIYIYRGTR
jgi:hypothetical protein